MFPRFITVCCCVVMFQMLSHLSISLFSCCCFLQCFLTIFPSWCFLRSSDLFDTSLFSLFRSFEWRCHRFSCFVPFSLVSKLIFSILSLASAIASTTIFFNILMLYVVGSFWRNFLMRPCLRLLFPQDSLSLVVSFQYKCSSYHSKVA